jgi:hypothetical protein
VSGNGRGLAAAGQFRENGWGSAVWDKRAFDWDEPWKIADKERFCWFCPGLTGVASAMQRAKKLVLNKTKLRSATSNPQRSLLLPGKGGAKDDASERSEPRERSEPTACPP